MSTGELPTLRNRGRWNPHYSYFKTTHKKRVRRPGSNDTDRETLRPSKMRGRRVGNSVSNSHWPCPFWAFDWWRLYRSQQVAADKTRSARAPTPQPTARYSWPAPPELSRGEGTTSGSVGSVVAWGASVVGRAETPQLHRQRSTRNHSAFKFVHNKRRYL